MSKNSAMTVCCFLFLLLCISCLHGWQTNPYLNWLGFVMGILGMFGSTLSISGDTRR